MSLSHNLGTRQAISLLRASALVIGSSAFTGLLWRLTGPSRLPVVSTFPALITATAAWALLAATIWLSAVCAAIWVEVLGALTWAPSRWLGASVGVRRALLGACGVVVLLGAPAHADVGHSHATRGPGSVIDGVPLPDRVTGESRGRGPAEARSVRVKAGDSLWSLCEDPHQSAAQTAARVAETYQHNRRLIGDDPDLIQPGQVIHLSKQHPKEPTT